MPIKGVSRPGLGVPRVANEHGGSPLTRVVVQPIAEDL